MTGYPLTALANQDLEDRRRIAARERMARRLAGRRGAPRSPIRLSVVPAEIVVKREARHAGC